MKKTCLRDESKAGLFFMKAYFTLQLIILHRCNFKKKSLRKC